MITVSDPGRWKALCDEFDALVEMDTGPRAERLAAIGTADPAARTILESLLAGDADPSSGLGRIESIFGAAPTPAAGPRADLLSLAGRTVAHFRIVEPVAAGGMGVVYRAIDTNLSRPVALKFPLPGHHLDRQGGERLLREARAAAALEHPNICGIYEVGETEEGQFFFAMPLYEGETLKARLARAGRLPIAEAVAIAVQLARGLAAAHRAGIVHRDLKPANVMVLPDGGVRILDFGIARVDDANQTRTQGTMGTVQYMSPEQVGGERLDRRTDLWALGVLLYEMLTGQRPFEGEREIAIAHAIVHAVPAPPRTLRPDIGAPLEDLVLALLAKLPADRPPSAGDVEARLADPVAGTARRPEAVRRTPWIWLAATAVTAAAAGVALLVRNPTPVPPVAPTAVALLPFDGTDYLAASLRDEIGARLSQLAAVAVIGEVSSLQYAGSDKPVGQIAQELEAAVLVRGTVEHAAGEVRLAVEMFDAREKQWGWRRTYRGPDSATYRLQLEATEGIAEALPLGLRRSERAVLRQGPIPNGEGYDLYLRGKAAAIGARRETSLPRIVEGFERAQAFFARARERDPALAAARAHLALAFLALGSLDGSTARNEPARLEAEAALRVDPENADAREALAVYQMRRNERREAVGELEQALALRRNSGALLDTLSVNLRALGRWEESAAALERASRLDPRNLAIHRQAATTYSRMRRYEQGIAHFDRLIALKQPADPFPQFIRGFMFFRLGNVDSLDAAIRRIPYGSDPGGMTAYARWTAHRIQRHHSEALASLDSAGITLVADELLYRPVQLLRAQSLGWMGDSTRARSAYQAARRLLEDSVRAHPQQSPIRVALALAYGGLGRHADAIREARTAVELAPISEDNPNSTAALGGVAEVYAQLGETERALEVLQLLLSMMAGREMSVPLVRLDPIFDPLRSDPRFEALLTRFSRN